ncbi:MAG: hypothetical protein GY755_02890 [Chloroflexi bacterium]|nr:hypothetical protein [Chloroflexota bacterium]
MKKILTFWHLLAGLLLGFGLGLAISWIIAPLELTDAPPSLLRTDFKDGYRALIASAYASTGDLERAEERLATLNDPDIITALENQTNRTSTNEDSPESLETLNALVIALKGESPAKQITNTPTPFYTQTPQLPTKTGTPATPTITFTPEAATATLTPIPINTRTPRATTEASLTPSTPYILATQDELCSTNISEGLLMVYVSDASKKAVPGAEIIVEWDGKEEHFFTGLKPELGNGYADFAMEANKSYALRLAAGSVAVSGLGAPPCQDDDGNHYWGSIRLRFEQP